MTNVKYQKLEDLREGNVQIEVKSGLELEYVFSALEGKDTNLNLEVILHDKARLNLLGVTYAFGGVTHRVNVKVSHRGPFSSSSILVKGVVADGSFVDFTGLLKIEKEALQTRAYLEGHLLLMSDDSRGLSKPALEIEANEVKASHGSTVGRLSAEKLFYLQSRGLPEDRAKELVSFGFLEDVTDRVKDRKVSDQLRYEVARRLWSGEQLKV